MAVLQFLSTLARFKPHSAMTKGVIGLNLVWTILAILAIVFQCHLPQPWQVRSDRCFNQVCWYPFQKVAIADKKCEASLLGCDWNI